MTRFVVLVVMMGLLGAVAHAEDAIDKALAQIGLTKETAVVDKAGMRNFGGDEFVMPLFTTLHDNPYRIPDYVVALKTEAATSAPSI